LRPLLEDPDKAWTRPAFTQVTGPKRTGYSVRTERWRYTEWGGGTQAHELYDYESDPGELTNLAGNSKYDTVIAEMRARIKEIQSK
jgi:uncharacterized sulfatase